MRVNLFGVPVATAMAGIMMLVFVSCPVNNVPQAFSVTKGSHDGGDFIVSSVNATEGTQISLTVSADTGFSFVEWNIAGATVNPTQVGGGNVWIFPMPAANVVVNAVFKKDRVIPETFAITRDTPDNGAFTVSHDAAEVGATITLTATPDGGYEFYAWDITGGIKPAQDEDYPNVWTFTMPAADIMVNALFKVIVIEEKPLAFTITQGVSANGSFTISRETATVGTTITLTVTATDADHEFYAWNITGASVTPSRVGDTGVWTFAMPAANITVNAVFMETQVIPETFAITMGVHANGAFTIYPIAAERGQTITLTITAIDEGYEFYAWNITGYAVNPVRVGDTGVWTFAMPAADIMVNAVFAASDVPPDTDVALVPQGIPGNFLAQAGHAPGVVVLTWQAVELANAYDVRHRLAGGSWNSPVDVGNNLTHTFTGLTGGQQYEFSVRARNATGPAINWAYFGPIGVNAPALDIDAGVWFETIFAYWVGTAGSTYNVYVAPTGTTNWRWVNNPSEAVVGQSTWTNNHSYLARVVDVAGNRWRVDVPGLAADMGQSYDLRVVELRDGSPTEKEGIVRGIRPPPFDRQGFAFSETSPFGPHGGTTGAYNLDGTLRPNAVVIYITPENANDFANPWNTTAGATGLFTHSRTVNRPGTNANAVSLLNATPLAIRVIGNPNLVFATRNNNQLDVVRTSNITIEGIGPDAVFDGFGLFIDRSSNIVVRNIHFRNWGNEDGILVQGAGGNPDNHGPFPDLNAIGNSVPEGRISVNTWITHNRFTVDNAGADGHVDYNNSSYFTQSYNIFTRNGRGGLAGNSTNSGFFRGTYHHNHYIDTNTRSPRLRASETHVFNNFFDYTSFSTNGYSIGAGHHASVIAEGNFFSNANAPFIISGQGHNNAGGSNTLTGDQLGFLITSLTTPANNPTSTHNLHMEQRIFDLAATLVPNHLGNARHFNPAADQGLPRNDNNRGPGRAFAWTLYPSPQAWSMPVNVTPAEEARQRVLDYAGPMRPR